MKTLGLLWFCLAAVFANAQDIRTYVKQHAAPVRSISPVDTSYDDLEAMGAAIGDARIVMLGEQDHGDAPAFLAKTRIIKYLHEKKGFNVLAFESDFYALNQGLDLTGEKVAADSFTKKNVFGIWTYCDACSHLFYNYLPATRSSAQPLVLAGFDNQLVLDQSRKTLVPRLDSLFRALDLPVTHRADYTSDILPALKALPDHYGGADVDLRATRQYLDAIGKEVRERLKPDDLWAAVVQNLIAEADQYAYFKQDWVKGSNYRDSMMALNLQWLATSRYPNEKIIVWAANGHIARFSADVQGKTQKMMGYYFTQDQNWRRKTYIVGFTSKKGEVGRLGWKTYKVMKPNANGLESWIDGKTEQAFIDFRAFHTSYPAARPSFHLKALSHTTNFTYDWTSVFDGVFYIRDMYPCQSIGH